MLHKISITRELSYWSEENIHVIFEDAETSFDEMLDNISDVNGDVNSISVTYGTNEAIDSYKGTINFQLPHPHTDYRLIYIYRVIITIHDIW